MANLPYPPGSIQPQVETSRLSNEEVSHARNHSVEIPQHGHNPSLQHGVDTNPDLALHYSHEHLKPHKHHAPSAVPDAYKSEMYTSGTTSVGRDLLEKPPQDYTTHTLNEKSATMVTDAEKGGMSPTRISTEEEGKPQKKYSFGAMYSKYKFVVHFFIWAVMTGYVEI